MNTAKEVHAMPILAQLLPEVQLSTALSELPVAGLTIDSREVQQGYLFVAVAGLHLHGKAFAEQAAANGAIAILIDAEDDVSASIPVIKIHNIDAQLSAIAGRFFGNPSYMVPVVGVTGTNGKTTCTQLLAQAFAYLGVPCGVAGTLGYGLISQTASTQNESLDIALQETGMTTADAISTQKICAELYSGGAGVMAMEVSSHGLVQHRVADIFIRTAVFTNLTHDHLDYHGSMEAYAEAKASLFTMPSVNAAVINLDDPFSSELIRRLRPEIELVTYSLDANKFDTVPASAHFSVKSMMMVNGGIDVVLLTPEGEFAVSTQLVGEFNISNLLAVVATLYVNRYALEKIVSCLYRLKPIAGRMEAIVNNADIQVVIDYAHTPDALQQALSALRVHTQGKLWCVFGCGGDRDREKRPQMASIAEEFADKIILTSDNPRTESSVQIFADIESGFIEPRDVIVDRAEAIEAAISQAKKGDLILIAGKGHEDYQIIGQQRFPFSDHAEARLALRKREQEGGLND